MKFKDYIKSRDGYLSENKIGRMVVGVLALLVLLQTGMLMNKTSIVVIQPWTLTQEGWVAKEDASVGYKEAWGWALAMFLGNTTPGNIEFIKERIKPMLSPAIYQEVVDEMEKQALEIKEERITIRFEPREVIYERESGKVFVYGYSHVKTASFNAKGTTMPRTYEFDLQISNYLPILEYMNFYDGHPKTIKKIELLESKEKRRKENESK